MGVETLMRGSDYPIPTAIGLRLMQPIETLLTEPPRSSVTFAPVGVAAVGPFASGVSTSPYSLMREDQEINIGNAWLDTLAGRMRSIAGLFRWRKRPCRQQKFSLHK